MTYTTIMPLSLRIFLVANSESSLTADFIHEASVHECAEFPYMQRMCTVAHHVRITRRGITCLSNKSCGATFQPNNAILETLLISARKLNYRVDLSFKTGVMIPLTTSRSFTSGIK
jgi:hypothetical protein